MNEIKELLKDYKDRTKSVGFALLTMYLDNKISIEEADRLEAISEKLHIEHFRLNQLDEIFN